MTEPTDYAANLRAAVRNLRRIAPERALDPDTWHQPDSPYAFISRQMIETLQTEIRDLRTELRRWALGMTAAIIVAFIVGMLQL